MTGWDTIAGTRPLSILELPEDARKAAVSVMTKAEGYVATAMTMLSEKQEAMLTTVDHLPQMPPVVEARIEKVLEKLAQASQELIDMVDEFVEADG